jgi:hypothetical protein
MNTHALAAEIVTKIRNSMQDSTLNQVEVVERMIREAMKQQFSPPPRLDFPEQRWWGQPMPIQQPPTWPPLDPHIPH